MSDGRVNYVTRNLTLCTPHQISFEYRIKKTEKGRACSMYGGGGTEGMYTRFLLGNLREEDHLKNPRIDGSIILKWISVNWDGEWTGSIWFRTVTGGGLL